MSKNLVVCCDGTNNDFKEHPSNVLKLARLAVDDDTQRVFYDPGVGTFSAHKWLGIEWVGEKLGALLGYGIKQNISDAYRFLMQHYTPGDRIFLFGFSRGAYTVRCLAAILSRYGLLAAQHENQLPYLIKDYIKRGALERTILEADDFAHQVSIHYLGVWDTVASVSGVVPLNDVRKTEDLTNIKTARQALAIDEKRGSFAPLSLNNLVAPGVGDIQDVWFAGVHSDVGGGYADRGLADIALEWMLAEARHKGLNLSSAPETVTLDKVLYQLHESYEGKWRILCKNIRYIDERANIHPSVTNLELRSSPYQPINLPL